MSKKTLSSYSEGVRLVCFCLSYGRGHILHQEEDHRFYTRCFDKNGSGCKFGVFSVDVLHCAM